MTPVFSRETLTQTTGTDIFNQQDRGLTYGLHAGGVLVVAALCQALRQARWPGGAYSSEIGQEASVTHSVETVGATEIVLGDHQAGVAERFRNECEIHALTEENCRKTMSG